MASLARPSVLPHCVSCTRRLASVAYDGWRPVLAQQQVRGKKKLAASQETDDLTVKLLKDVKTFGKKGTPRIRIRTRIRPPATAPLPKPSQR